MGLDREEERDVDVDSFSDQSSNRDGAFRCSWHLDHEVGAIDRLPKSSRLFDRSIGRVRNSRRYFDRDEPVAAARRAVYGGKMVAGVADIGCLQQFEKLPAGQTFFFRIGYLLVVGVARRQRLLKDRRVGSHAGERVLADAAVELAIVEHSAVDAVEPDRLPNVVKLL